MQNVHDLFDGFQHRVDFPQYITGKAGNRLADVQTDIPEAAVQCGIGNSRDNAAVVPVDAEVRLDRWELLVSTHTRQEIQLDAGGAVNKRSVGTELSCMERAGSKDPREVSAGQFAHRQPVVSAGVIQLQCVLAAEVRAGVLHIQLQERNLALRSQTRQRRCEFETQIIVTLHIQVNAVRSTDAKTHIKTEGG